MNHFHRKFLLLALLAACTLQTVTAQQVKVFSDIPGRSPSDQYLCRIRQLGSNEWKDAFDLQTVSKAEIKNSAGDNISGYKENLLNWSASWIAFEFGNASVEVEISKRSGSFINRAMVRPVGATSAATITNGKVYLTFDKPANVNVDIDGQMESVYTGMGYTGPPVHTISIFGNPLYRVPNLTNPSVKALNPGDSIPDKSSWDTLYFKPGIHRIGTPWQISSNKVLYIPGDAIVHGTIQPPNTFGSGAATRWTVYGSGTLSGEEVARNTATKDNKPFTYQASGVRLEGFVVADPAHHTFNMNNITEDTTQVNVYENLKVLGWRVNGDGLNAFRNSTITHCFFRCQDDLFYYGGNNVKISQCVCWTDYNGSVLYVTKGAKTFDESYFKDIVVIYHRAGWHYWKGGRVISFRDRQPGNTIKNVQIKNVLVEDPFPAFAPIYMEMTNPSSSTALYDYSNIVIENLRQPNPAVWGKGDDTYGRSRNTMLGLDSNRCFENITFKNCFYNGKWMRNFEEGDFLRNDFNKNVTFIVDGEQSIQEVGNRIRVFTNPADRTLNMQLEPGLIHHIQLFHTFGKRIYNLTTHLPLCEIDCSRFDPGIYFLCIDTDQKTYRSKVTL
jgi:hypothetical protein